MPKSSAMNVFCDNVRRLLTVRGLTHQDAAELLGMPRTNFSRMVRGQHEPRLGTIQALADVLGVSVADLLDEQLSVADQNFEKVGS